MSMRGATGVLTEFARNGLGVPLLVMTVLAMMVLRGWRIFPTPARRRAARHGRCSRPMAR